jgi:glycosyltransferase 2 family protein
VKNNKFTTIKKSLPFIGLILFIYTIYQLDITKIKDAFFSIHPFYILLILPFTFPRILIRNYTWQLILKEQNIHVSFINSMKIFLIGYFYGSITPGYLGQLMRIPHLKEYTGQPYGKLFINSTIETIIHTFSLYAMILIGAFLVLGDFPELFMIAAVWMTIFLSFLLFFVGKNRGEWFFKFVIRYFIPKKFRCHLNRFSDSFYQDFPRIKSLFLPISIGVLTWIIIFSQKYLLVHALDMSIPYLYFLLLFPLANAAGFIPISFAGLGTREFTAIILFSTLFTVSAEKMFVVSLLGFVVTDLFTGFIGFIVSVHEARKKGTTVRKLRNQIINEGKQT